MKARASACPPSLPGALSVMHLPPEVPVRCLLMAHNFDYQSNWHLGTKVCAERAEMCKNEWGGQAAAAASRAAWHGALRARLPPTLSCTMHSNRPSP